MTPTSASIIGSNNFARVDSPLTDANDNDY